MTDRPRLLPLLGPAGHAGRDAKTCLYRCGNACDHPVPNESDNPYLGDVVNAAMTRRGVVRAGAVGALVLGFGAAPPPPRPQQAAEPRRSRRRRGTRRGGGRPAALTFKPIPPNQLDTLIVPNGYDHAVVIRWGDPVVPGAPGFDVHRQTARRQSEQFGYNNDFLAVLPLGRDGRRALLVSNHEYTNEELMFPGFTSLEALTVEQVRVAMAAHGMSVVELERVGGTGQWRPVGGRHRPYNRRITMLATPFRFTGPAAGIAAAADRGRPAGQDPIGTLNNCAGGVTPWGTVLSGEENFNQYFVGGDARAGGAQAEAGPLRHLHHRPATRAARASWDRAEERFDLAKHPNEAHRFGWVVEVDPYDPRSPPRKHTALGRFKHEGANVIVARDGRVVAYMGDDERFDYLYKFVSDEEVRARATRPRPAGTT